MQPLPSILIIQSRQNSFELTKVLNKNLVVLISYRGKFNTGADIALAFMTTLPVIEKDLSFSKSELCNVDFSSKLTYKLIY